MTQKKKYTTKEAKKKLEAPVAGIYSSPKQIQFFKSFEEQEEYERIQMAALTPIERLQQLRQIINLAYGMHGYDPDNLPKKHTLTIL